MSKCWRDRCPRWLTPEVSFMSDYSKCVSQHHNPDSPSAQVRYLFSSIIFSISSEVTFLNASDGLWRASYSTGERTSYRSRKTQAKWKHQLARSCCNSLILEMENWGWEGVITQYVWAELLGLSSPDSQPKLMVCLDFSVFSYHKAAAGIFHLSRITSMETLHSNLSFYKIGLA